MYRAFVRLVLNANRIRQLETPYQAYRLIHVTLHIRAMDITAILTIMKVHVTRAGARKIANLNLFVRGGKMRDI